VPEIIMIGSVLVRTKLLVLIASIILAYYVTRWKLGSLRVDEANGRTLLDKLVNALIIAVLVWKLTPLLMNPSLLWTRPMSLLSYTGGVPGIVLGVACGLIYGVLALRRSGILQPLALDVLAFAAIIALIPFRSLFWEYGIMTDLPWGIKLTDSLNRYHPVNLYAGLAALIVAIYALCARRTRWGTGTIARDILIGLGIGWFVVTYADRGEPLLWLTLEQWLLLALIACGAGMPALAKLIQMAAGEHTTGGKEMIDVVKETASSSPEQRKQAEANRAEGRDRQASQPVDKKLDGPNRPAE
jgi:hypothetical protein